MVGYRSVAGRGLSAGRAPSRGASPAPSSLLTFPFSTAFTGSDESPLSEGGVWLDHSNSWKKVRRVGNVARPASLSSAEDDAYALLNPAKFAGGIPNNVEVIATLDLGSGTTQEHEILLRASDNSTQTFAYECLYNAAGAGSVQIMRWNGDLHSFVEIGTNYVNPGGGATGNQLRATIVGSAITFYWRANSGNSWTQVATANDSTYQSGSCGISFYATVAGGGSIDACGFTDFQATAL